MGIVLEEETDQRLPTAVNPNDSAIAEAKGVRIAQSWEDADIVIEALAIEPGDTCLSVAQGPDTTLSLLTQDPGRIIAVDSNPAQIHALELRVAAMRELTHTQFLQFMGTWGTKKRRDLYLKCRRVLSGPAREFWDRRLDLLLQGLGNTGNFEQYLLKLRKHFLPVVHNQQRIEAMLESNESPELRQQFYEQHWDTWRWQRFLKLAFSNRALRPLIADTAMLQYTEEGEDLAAHLEERLHHAMVHLSPNENPFLEWIFRGYHVTSLPHSLRKENFDKIRSNLDRIEWHCLSVTDVFDKHPDVRFQRFHMSTAFEYLSPVAFSSCLRRLVEASSPNARLAYWNLLVNRRRPAALSRSISPLRELGKKLYAQDKGFIYRDFIVEEITG